jgi:hypothetical protein
MYVTSSAAVVKVMLAGGSWAALPGRALTAAGPQRDVVAFEPPRHILDVRAIETRGDLPDAFARVVSFHALAGNAQAGDMLGLVHGRAVGPAVIGVSVARGAVRDAVTPARREHHVGPALVGQPERRAVEAEGHMHVIAGAIWHRIGLRSI